MCILFFTVCIPTYNRKNTILRTLASLENQTFIDFEVVIIDDGSTDGTDILISSYLVTTKLKLRYYKKKNGGKHTALNIGIQKARGDFFIILDSDDWLEKDALGDMYYKWTEIDGKEEYCGIMGRCINDNGKLIGKMFPEKMVSTTYIDFHFISGPKYGPFGDCCECVKSSVLKQYAYPDNKYTKFVPEAYITDQIGLKYKLLCTNKVYKNVEYRTDGITHNVDSFMKKNIVGYIYYYVILLDEVFLKCKSIPLKIIVITWWKYWNAIALDIGNMSIRCKKITFIGKVVKFVLPIINWLHRKKHKSK